MLKYLIALIGLSALPAAGQINYVVQKTTTLSAAAEVVTIQQPASGQKRLVNLIGAYVDCSAACVITLERNGTPATATSLPTIPINPDESSSTAVAFSSSNVGVGIVQQVTSLQAGNFVVFDLTGYRFLKNSDNGNNFTIRTSSLTGTVHITIKFVEQ